MIEFEFESTPETDAMLKQICVKECFVRCKDCKYWEEESSGRTYCERTMFWIGMDADDFCSRGEKKDE